MASDRQDFALRRTKTGFFNTISRMFSSSPIDDDFYEDLLDQLITADVGYETSQYLCDELERRVKRQRAKSGDEALGLMRDIIGELLTDDKETPPEPLIILLIGVNGVGKTTSRGKLAHLFKTQGKKVLLAAADTFRARAADQLEEWAGRAGVPIVRHDEGADPASVVYRAAAKAKSEGFDILICDTAGRLHNKKNLMAELGKVKRVAANSFPEAGVQTLLVLEAMTGQNAISQAKEFISAAGADGIILTKLDGTAKGGSVISVKKTLGVPVKYVGLGEGIDDLAVFDPTGFADSLISKEEQE